VQIDIVSHNLLPQHGLRRCVVEVPIPFRKSSEKIIHFGFGRKQRALRKKLGSWSHRFPSRGEIRRQVVRATL